MADKTMTIADCFPLEYGAKKVHENRLEPAQEKEAGDLTLRREYAILRDVDSLPDDLLPTDGEYIKARDTVFRELDPYATFVEYLEKSHSKFTAIMEASSERRILQAVIKLGFRNVPSHPLRALAGEVGRHPSHCGRARTSGAIEFDLARKLAELLKSRRGIEVHFPALRLGAVYAIADGLGKTTLGLPLHDEGCWLRSRYLAPLGASAALCSLFLDARLTTLGSYIETAISHQYSLSRCLETPSFQQLLATTVSEARKWTQGCEVAQRQVEEWSAEPLWPRACRLVDWMDSYQEAMFFACHEQDWSTHMWS